MKKLLIYLPLILLLACTKNEHVGIPTDTNATQETTALYHNLKQLAYTSVLYGHQDDLAYGYSWWAEDGRSDVKESVGAYPAVIGWELGDLSQGVEENLDGVRFDNMKHWIKQAYEGGSINTISWHMNHPVTGGDSWDTTPGVSAILPGGTKHSLYKDWLDIFADFLSDLTGERGEYIPIIFRPFHEHTGSWFWWGDDQTSIEDYRAIWIYTLEYLRDQKGIHHLIYAYSPDGGGGYHFQDYMKKYPGDTFVDILGFDDYASFMRDTSRVEELSAELGQIVEWAREKDKIAAWTETGLEAVAEPQWFTNSMLAAIKHHPSAMGIAYALTWRNANFEREQRNHFYAPHPDHESVADFIRFYQDSLTLFQDGLPNLYEIR
jgi:mannan endo-1,4-beta-mannosidase